MKSTVRVLLLLLCGATTFLLVQQWSAEDPGPLEQEQPVPDPVPLPEAQPLDIVAAATLLGTAKPQPFRTDKPSDRPLHVLSNLAPGTFVAIRALPKVKEGIRMPDGSYLPFLNGMTAAPPIVRDPIHGPVPPVIGKQVDEGGFEWWVHADGSTTTSRYAHVTGIQGTYWDPSSAHSAIPDQNTYMKLPPDGR